MTPLPLDSIWDVLGGLLSLNPEGFRAIRQFSDNDIDTLTLLIVFSAGFSQAVAQSIILFANRVKPVRFFISLLLAALLFVVGYGFWSLSIWVTGLLVLRNPIPWQTVTDVLAFGYLPLTFSFFGALPYLRRSNSADVVGVEPAGGSGRVCHPGPTDRPGSHLACGLGVVGFAGAPANGGTTDCEPGAMAD
jgi:hypothetical protein